jgi:hypothetical protein
MENCAAASNRRSSRSKVLLSATIEFGDRSHPVKLRNLSEHGALVQGAHSVQQDSQVLFRRNDLCVAGYIAWVEGDYAGIAFDNPLERKVVLRQVSRATARPAPPGVFSRPAVGKHELTPQERSWIDQWMSTTGKDPLED